MQANTTNLLRYSAPAALATSPRRGLSETYSFLSTIQVVEALESNNWAVVEARQTPAKHPGKEAYRRHELILADRDVVYNGVFTEVPRVILSNSHDGGAAFKLRAGLLVTACFNGLYVPDGLIQSVSIRHSRRTTEEVVETANAFRANAELITDNVAKFRAIDLSIAAAYEFAKAALNLRQPAGFVAPQDVLQAQRSEDAGTNLWKTFNRVQEWMLRGQFAVHNLTTGRVRKARPIKAIDESTKLNLGLWDLASQFSLN
jgi:uncharacterized protein DUF932